jgi:hypothetical protein
MDYGTGVGLAFLLWLFYAASCVVRANSLLARNLAKVGMRISYLDLKPTPMTAADVQRSLIGRFLRASLAVLVALPFVLGSWLYVLWFVGAIIFAKSKDAGAPTAVREWRWRMKNVDMSFDDAVTELLKLSAIAPEQMPEARAALIGDLRGRGISAPLS